MRLSARLAPVLFVPLALFGAASCSAGTTTTSTGPTISQSADPGTNSSVAGSDTEPATTAAPTDPTAAPDTTEAANPHVTVAARVTASSVKVHADPDENAKVLTEIGLTTELGSKSTLLALQVQDEWVEVALPIRPNGSTGWLKKSAVELRTSTRAISVDLAARKLVLSEDGQPILTTEVAIGSEQNPTPTGSFYVTDLLDTGSPNGAYGPFAFGLSGHSETLTEFGGGDGQLGIHGTNEPASIGQAVSHGCVRVPNDIVRQLVDLVPLGTPVTIS